MCEFGGKVACVKAEPLPPHSKVGVGHLRVTATLGVQRRLGGVSEEFGEAEDAGVVAGFALDVVYAGPVGVGFFGWGRDTGDGDFDFDAVVEAAETDLTGRGAIGVKVEAQFAGGDDGGLELFDVVVGEASGIGEDSHGATRGGGKAFVVVEGEAEVERIFRHGYWLLAQATSQASRQSAQ